MPTPPDPAVLYPDIAACGDLAAALRAEGDGCLDAVPLMPSDSAPLSHVAVESTLPHRKLLVISAWSYERGWSIRGEEAFQGMALVDGRTDDLAQIAGAARAWHDGVPLDGIRQVAPFAHLTGRFEVPDNDPARLTESEWQHLRKEAAELDTDWQETHHNLIEAAYAAPALRALYPFTSHWALRFSTSIRPALTLVGPILSVGSDGTYGVRGLMSQDGDRFATAQEAVAVAVRQLPSGLGPTTLGG
ncbi:DUF6193 family natural product biosynthesis protein [Streptomyces sp. NPDC057554]|uniref:DUF6193 family natural product biosynthesis protein n=1 Tax=Streptomyces sp. NPDC057554 TaxID=3350538 RepID=UPI0036CA51DE